MNLQMEARLRETLEQQKHGDLTSAAGGKSVGDPNHLEATLQQLLTAARTQASRLAKMESSCLGSSGAGTGMNVKNGFHLRGDDPTGHSEQEVTGETALEDVLAALQGVKGELEELKLSRQASLPAGKTSFLLSAVCLFSCFVSFTLYLFFIQSAPLVLVFLQLSSGQVVCNCLGHELTETYFKAQQCWSDLCIKQKGYSQSLSTKSTPIHLKKVEPDGIHHGAHTHTLKGILRSLSGRNLSHMGSQYLGVQVS